MLTFTNEIFRQMIGIPMGSDPAPFIANLFLYLYENRFMNKLKKEDLRCARKLRHVFRFIDDLIALNDDDEFFGLMLKFTLGKWNLNQKIKVQNLVPI